MSAPRPAPTRPPLFRYVLRLGDLSLVLGQRLGEWVGHSPALEEDLGLANIALDLIGQARLLLSYAGEIEGRGRGEDELAFLREHGEYFNRDPGGAAERRFRPDHRAPGADRCVSAGTVSSAWRHPPIERLAAIAAKAVKEDALSLALQQRLAGAARRRHRGKSRAGQSALEALWPYTVELFAEDELDRHDGRSTASRRDLRDVQRAWAARIDEILAEATLRAPADRPHAWHGKRGQHSEHLGYILAEMQHLQRTYPGARW